MILLHKYLKIYLEFFFANSFLLYKRCKYLQMKLQIQLLHIQHRQLFQLRRCRVWVYAPFPIQRQQFIYGCQCIVQYIVVAVFAFVCILFSSNSSCRHISQYARETSELICTYCMAGSCQGWFQSELIQHWLSQFAKTIRLCSLQGVLYLYGLVCGICYQ